MMAAAAATATTVHMQQHQTAAMTHTDSGGEKHKHFPHTVPSLNRTGVETGFSERNYIHFREKLH